MGEQKKTYRAAGIGLAVVVAFLAASAWGLHATSTMEFCTSCHEMEQHREELKFSSHTKDKDGNVISCSQCHIPAGFGPRYLAGKAYSGLKDLFIHVVEQPEEINRVAQQPVARRFVDDANCLKCHEDLYRDAKDEKAISQLGKIAHDAYLGTNGQAKSNCVGCHINLAHLPEFDRRLEVNSEFAARIQQKEAAH